MGYPQIRRAHILIYFWGLIQWRADSELENIYQLRERELSAWGILSEIEITLQQVLSHLKS